MIKKLEITGELTIDSRDKETWLAINRTPLSEFLMYDKQKPWVEIEQVLLKAGEDYIETEGFWQVGDRVVLEEVFRANRAHEHSPEEQPLYLGRMIEAELGKAVITIEFVTE